MALPIAGEMPLYSQLPVISAMLAQSGPDAQVNLHVVVNGREGRRLEIRRYHDHAVVEGDRLRPGLPRDKAALPETALGIQIDRRLVRLHAVDLTAPEHPIVFEATPERDLRAMLGEKGGPWLIQSRLETRYSGRSFGHRRGCRGRAASSASIDMPRNGGGLPERQTILAGNGCGASLSAWARVAMPALRIKCRRSPMSRKWQ